MDTTPAATAADQAPPALPALTTTTAAAPPSPDLGDPAKMTREDFTARIRGAREASARELAEALGLEGVKTREELRAKFSELRAAGEKTAAELAAAQKAAADLEAAAKRAEAMGATLAQHARSTLEQLPQQARDAVVKLAGDDPIKQLEQIDLLRASGLMPSPRGWQGATRTSPAPTGAPAKPTPPPAPSPFEHYQLLQQSNPNAAAHFYNANRAAIEASRPRR